MRVFEAVVQGAQDLIRFYVRPSSDDHVVIAYTAKTREKAALIDMLLPASVSRSMFAFRPYRDSNFKSSLEAALGPCTVPRQIVLTLEDDNLSHSDILGDLYTRARPSFSIVRLISCDDDTFATAFRVPPEALSARNAGFLSMLMGDHDLEITTRSGTSLSVVLESKYEWISSRGVERQGAFVILPAGEVATYPARISGELVADGAVRVNVAHRIPIDLSAYPVKVQIVDSAISSFHCGDPKVSRFIEECLSRDNVVRVGELGFGSNFGVEYFSPLNSHTNERVPGVHIGFGTPNQPERLVPYDADIHLDLVAKGGTVSVDNVRTIDLESPRFDAVVRHPPLIRDQDVAGDCCDRGCGLVSSGIRKV